VFSFPRFLVDTSRNQNPPLPEVCVCFLAVRFNVIPFFFFSPHVWRVFPLPLPSIIRGSSWPRLRSCSLRRLALPRSSELILPCHPGNHPDSLFFFKGFSLPRSPFLATPFLQKGLLLFACVFSLSSPFPQLSPLVIRRPSRSTHPDPSSFYFNRPSVSQEDGARTSHF